MRPDPTRIVLSPGDVKAYDPDPLAVRRARFAEGDIAVHVGPDVHLTSTAAFLLFRIIDAVHDRDCEVTIEVGALKAEVLRVLGFAAIATIKVNRNDDSWLFSDGLDPRGADRDRE